MLYFSQLISAFRIVWKPSDSGNSPIQSIAIAFNRRSLITIGTNFVCIGGEAVIVFISWLVPNLIHIPV